MVVVGTPPFGALLLLSEPLRHQDTERARVQVDDTRLAAGGFDRTEAVLPMFATAEGALDPGAVGLDDLLIDHQAGPTEVDIVPPHPDSLAPT
ncbi:hypothetical protein A9310_19890 [Gordonia sp. UCD-TK1]|nr:hypothetical protein A9310_19890 [Gordonia sp. UCD-TK1]